MTISQSNISTVGSIASEIFEKTHGKPKYLALFPRWSEFFANLRGDGEIVGENLAEICAPQKVSTQGNRKILVLKTKKGRSLEVQHESEKILRAINSFLENDIFDNLVIFQMDINEDLR